MIHAPQIISYHTLMVAAVERNMNRPRVISILALKVIYHVKLKDTTQIKENQTGSIKRRTFVAICPNSVPGGMLLQTYYVVFGEYVIISTIHRIY